MKIFIIGSSIAGATAALALARKGFDVEVFEQKPFAEVHKKLCGNIVTSAFFSISRELGLNAKKIVLKKFNKAHFFSKNKRITVDIEDYLISRKELLFQLVSKAKSEGAVFNFNSTFLKFEKRGKNYKLFIKKGSKEIVKETEVLIGADGVLSRVAKSAGFKQKKFVAAIQAETKTDCPSNEYFVFFGKEFGLYSYLFPSDGIAKIGSVAQNFSHFVKFLKVKKVTNQRAHPIPFYGPFSKFRKGNVWLIGDSAGMIKFSMGGIIPSMHAAIALADFLKGDTKKLRKLKKDLFVQYLILKAIRRLKDKDFDYALNLIENDKRLRDFLKKRDETSLSFSNLKLLFERRFFRYALKLLF